MLSASEIIDVLDAAGESFGVTKTKVAIHRDGDWHRAAHVWLVNSDGRVLLQRRSESKENWPGRWDVSAAGHVAAGESALDAAVRETHEELGLRIAPEELRPIATVREQCVLNDGQYIDNEIHEVFVVRREIDPGALVLDATEVSAVTLVALEDLERYDPVPHVEEYRALRSFLAAPHA